MPLRSLFLAIPKHHFNPRRTPASAQQSVMTANASRQWCSACTLARQLASPVELGIRSSVTHRSVPVARAPLPAWAIGPFERPPESAAIVSPTFDSSFDCPMRGTPVRWEALHTFNPAAIVRDGKVYLLYRAEDDFGEMAISAHTSRLGLAVSDDGITFQRHPTPVVYPADDSQKATEWDGGCEDPRLVEAPDGSYVLTYTQWDRRVPRLAIATSNDLHTWVKHGPAFKRVHGEKYHELHSKAGSIVCERTDDDRLVAVKVGGKYWMYWGEHTVR
ncbi:MAG: hypothetical protein EOO80_17880, partial [Oxalobacteraceae bacterium]